MMKFIISRETLLKPLTLIAGAVEKRNVLPILSNILITLDGQSCILTGTDLEVELAGHVGLQEGAGKGALTVPARKLLDICRALPDASNIEFSHENQKLTIRTNTAKFNLATLPASEFPHIEASLPQEGISISASSLQALFKQTHFAMALEDVRYFLNGALLEIESSGVRVAATDGHRLAISHILNISADDPFSTQAIIPRKGVIEILRLFQNPQETLTLHFGSHFLKIASAEFTLITKLIEGRYPDYRKVIPRTLDKFLLVDKERFQQALQCIAVVTSEKYRGIRLQIRPQSMHLTTKNPEQEEAEEEVPLHAPTSGELDIGFNVSYLLDALNAIEGGLVKLFFRDANNGIILENPEATGGRYVVMPMKL